MKKFLIKNGKIFFPDRQFRKGNIVIQDKKIKHIYFNEKEKIDVKNSLDANGKIIVPGFIDSHTHLLQEAIKIMRINLSKADSVDGMFDMIKEGLKQYKRGDTIIASDFDESNWPVKQIPDRIMLDKISPQNPLVIRRICGHIAVANTLALKKIGNNWKGVNKKTGVMTEDVPLNINRIFPPESSDVIKGLRQIVKKANAYGITSINEIVNASQVHFYEQLGEDLTLNVRVYIPLSEIGEIKKPDIAFKKTTFGGIKLFADGSIGARTAANDFYYKDTYGKKGKLIYTTGKLLDIIEDAESEGIQLVIHAIGNRAIRQVLTGYERKIGKTNPLRHRIEHCELIDEKDIDRMAKLEIIASMQPNFISQWSQPGGMYEALLGNRYRFNNPVAQLMAKGIIVAFGSDCMPLSPLFGIKSVMNAPFSSQRISKEDALFNYTKNSAYAGFTLFKEGEIKPGKEANLVILDNKLKKVYMTIFKGRCVYSKN